MSRSFRVGALPVAAILPAARRHRGRAANPGEKSGLESGGIPLFSGETHVQTNETTGESAPPPHAQVIQMATGYWVSRIVYAAAKLDLADRLADGPKSAADLAAATGTDASALHRLMRALAALGIMAGRDGKRFALTPLGETLKTGAPGSARATVLTLGGPFGWRAWEEILHSVRTGKTGFEKAFGMGAF